MNVLAQPIKTTEPRLAADAAETGNPVFRKPSFAVRAGDRVDREAVPKHAATLVQQRAVGAHENEVAVTRVWTNSTGQVQEKSSTYIHLSPGLNVRDPANGGWKEARVTVRATPEGAVTEGGWFTCRFAASPAVRSAFSVTADTGERLSGRVLGLRYLDLASGKSVTLAEIRDAPVQVTEDGRVIYLDAFEGASGDLVYHVNESGRVEQDVVIRGTLANPSEWGLDPASTVLQAVSEFINPPAAEIRRQRLALMPIAANNRRAEIEDHQVIFETFALALGRAFPLASGDEAKNAPREAIVIKEWQSNGDSAFLFESVPYPVYRELEAMAFSDSTEAGDKRPGVVLDWVVVASQSSYTFGAYPQNPTYRISGTVSLSSGATIQANAVLKFDRGATLSVSGTLNCPTSGKAILTGIDDFSVGEPIGTDEPNGTYAQMGLLLMGTPSGNPRNLEIRYAYTGLYGYFGGTVHSDNMRFIKCTEGIASYAGTLYMSTVTFCDVPTQFRNAGTAYYFPSGVTVDPPPTVNFVNLNNGAVLRGWVEIPIAVFTCDPALKDVLVTANGEKEYGLDYYANQNGVADFVGWDTVYVNNGAYTLQLGIKDSAGNEVLSNPVSVQVDNDIWFPDHSNVTGDDYRVEAKSKFTGGTWTIWFYNTAGIVSYFNGNPNNYFASIGGTINASGWFQHSADNDPEPGFKLSAALGGAVPNSWDYMALAAVTPAGGGAQSTAVQFKFKEVPWPWNSSNTKFVVAYQQIFFPNDPIYSGGHQGALALRIMMEGIAMAAHTRNNPGLLNYASHYIVQGQNLIPQSPGYPHALINPVNWNALRLFLGVKTAQDAGCRNFYYFGHGGKQHIGGWPKGVNRPNELARVPQIAALLGNPDVGVYEHSFRFVFLDGCNTAKGGWPDAFGIPSTLRPKAWFDSQGYKRYRAFMGWNQFVQLGVGGNPTTIFFKHLDFSGGFFVEWATGKTLEQATLDSAAFPQHVGIPNWSELQKLKVTGYKDLVWQDTVP